jgi:hypothetical protein
MDPFRARRARQARWARWALTGALLLLTLMSAVAVLAVLPPTYQSSSSVVLLASPQASEPYGDNPYLSFSPSLTLASDVVSSEVMSSATVSRLDAVGFSGSYSVQPATYTTDTTGSVLLVAATGSTAAAAERNLRAVGREINNVLAGMQSGDPAADRIRAVTISVSPASRDLGQAARVLTVLIGAGLVISVGFPWLAESRIAGRGREAGSWPITVPYLTEPAGNGRRTVSMHAASRDNNGH